MIASLSFCLAATCSVVLWFFYEEDRSFDAEVFQLPFHGPIVTQGMIALMLFGAPLQTAFDLSMFFLQACPLCRGSFFPDPVSRLFLWLGTHLAFLITVGALALAINVMLIRASILDDGDDAGVTYKLKHYNFMLYYFLQIFAANFVVFPLGTFTVFSGVLGCCGRIPGLGGRPYQVRKHRREQGLMEI